LLSFRPFNLETSPWFLINEEEGTHYLFLLKTRRLHQFEHPFTGSFCGYRESMQIINSLGYLGKYQFGIETLKSVGVRSSSSFE
jgi:hypothetical protein